MPFDGQSGFFPGGQTFLEDFNLIAGEAVGQEDASGGAPGGADVARFASAFVKD